MIERNFFELIVAGENPASIIQPYNKNILLEKPVIVYKFEDAEFLRAKHIEFYNSLIYSGKFTDDEVGPTVLNNDAKKLLMQATGVDFIRSF